MNSISCRHFPRKSAAGITVAGVDATGLPQKLYKDKHGTMPVLSPATGEDVSEGVELKATGRDNLNDGGGIRIAAFGVASRNRTMFPALNGLTGGRHGHLCAAR